MRSLPTLALRVPWSGERDSSASPTARFARRVARCRIEVGRAALPGSLVVGLYRCHSRELMAAFARAAALVHEYSIRRRRRARSMRGLGLPGEFRAPPLGWRITNHWVRVSRAAGTGGSVARTAAIRCALRHSERMRAAALGCWLVRTRSAWCTRRRRANHGSMLSCNRRRRGCRRSCPTAERRRHRWRAVCVPQPRPDQWVAGTRWWLMATTTVSVRLRVPSLVRTLRAWNFTVASVITSRSAIC